MMEPDKKKAAKPVTAISVYHLSKMKYKLMDFQNEWYEAFSKPEQTGVWFIWGGSGNGKSSFIAQLTRELSRFGRVAINSLEQRFGYSIQKNCLDAGLLEVGKRVLILNEPMSDLSERLSKPRSPYCVIVDSFQHARLNYPQYLAFKEKHRDKLIIFISHADGKKPEGRPARSVMYDADLKIWVEGFKAFSKGRFTGPTGEYIIWDAGADKYWGNKTEK